MEHKKTRGAVLTEYGILAGLIAVGAIGAVLATGDKTADIFCRAANDLSEMSGRGPLEKCAEGGIILEENERFTKAPVRVQASFIDVLFEKTKSGEQVILASVEGDRAANYTLYSDIMSGEEYDSERSISSCYLLPEAPGPICGTTGAGSSISVPSNAIAIGYSVFLTEDLSMPWTSAVDIEIESAENDSQRFNINVAREEPDALEEPITFAFGTHTYDQTAAGWTYGEFVTLEGKFNRPVTLTMRNVSGPSVLRRACYRISPEGEPSCGSSQTINYTPTVEVPVGAKQIGYAISLPEPDAGPDWVSVENFEIPVAGNAHSSQATIIRPNEPYQEGGIVASFSEPYTFNETDEGSVYGEFIELTGPRNTDLTLDIRSITQASNYRYACYTTVVDGPKTCTTAAIGTNTISITVPPEAVQIGYRVSLPGTASGPDWTAQHKMTLKGPETDILDQIVEVVRPNAPYQEGGIVASFSEPYRFAQEDEYQTYGEFIELTGPRNTDLTLEIRAITQTNNYRYACYTTVIDGPKNCTNAAIGTNTRSITVPPEAVQVGYRISLPAATSGPDWTAQHKMTLKGPETDILDQIVEVVRPNDPYQEGGVVAGFSEPYTFNETDEGLVYGEFIELTGPRNTDLTLKVRAVTQTTNLRYACFTTVIDGPKTCTTAAQGSNTRTIAVPPEAVQIGYRISLPAATSGPSWTAQHKMTLTGPETDILDQVVEVVRPNADYQEGASSEFSPSFTAADDASFYTDGEFVPVTGPRNTNLTMEVTDTGSVKGANKRACYKAVVGGSAICGDTVGAGRTASASIPPSAVEIGYQLYIPHYAFSQDNIFKVGIVLEGPETVLLVDQQDFFWANRRD